MITVSLVVPVFNEEKTIPIFYKKVREFDELKPYDVEIVFVNDGSSDGTEELINSYAAGDRRVQALSFTRNFGKEPALFCGLEHATGQYVVPMDVDLQDPIEVLPKLLKKAQEGYDIVLAKRANRDTDSWLKRTSAEWFYRIHNEISYPRIEPNVGDFRCLTQEVVQRIVSMPERNLFMKGMYDWGGGKTAIVEYVREARSAGSSKFNGWKLWNLALEGITSFSTVPLRIWTYVGALVSFISFIYAMVLIGEKIFLGNPVRGYPSIMVAILFLGGVQLIGIGTLGEYIGRIYIETKHRPRFILKDAPAKTTAHASDKQTPAA